MKPGSSGNLMFLISEFGDVLPMSSFRRTSDALFSHTWRNAFLWDIQVVTRAGSSTIQPHKSISSQSVQNLTSASFLDSPSTRQHHQSISHLQIHHLCFLCRLLSQCSIYREKMTFHHKFAILNCQLISHSLKTLV